MKDALKGVAVVDLTNAVAGNYCGKLLALNGATVTIAEPLDGSVVRQQGPPSPQRSAVGSPLFRHLNAGKRSLAVDLGSDCGRQLVRRVAAVADVVLYDATSAPWLRLADDYPALIACQVDEFPQGSKWATWRGSEMIHQALSGVMNVTGHPDREPLYGAGQRAYYAGGVTAYITVTSALYERNRSGRGQHVVASVMESSAAMAQNTITQYSYNGTYSTRRRYPGMLSILKCSDNWVVLFALRHWAGLCETFDVPELFDDPRFADPVARGANWHEATDVLTTAAKRFTADELVDRGQQRKVSIEKVHSMADLVRSPQVQARQMLLRDNGNAGLGPVFRSRAEHGVPGVQHSPEIGEHTAKTLGEIGIGHSELEELRRAGVVK